MIKVAYWILVMAVVLGAKETHQPILQGDYYTQGRNGTYLYMHNDSIFYGEEYKYCNKHKYSSKIEARGDTLVQIFDDADTTSRPPIVLYETPTTNQIIIHSYKGNRRLYNDVLFESLPADSLMPKKFLDLFHDKKYSYTYERFPSAQVIMGDDVIYTGPDFPGYALRSNGVLEQYNPMNEAHYLSDSITIDDLYLQVEFYKMPLKYYYHKSNEREKSQNSKTGYLLEFDKFKVFKTMRFIQRGLKLEVYDWLGNKIDEWSYIVLKPFKRKGIY